MRFWPRGLFQERERDRSAASEHARSTRDQEENVAGEPIPKWVIAILAAAAAFTLLWAYWLIALVF
jgi:hypothetical protein